MKLNKIYEGFLFGLGIFLALSLVGTIYAVGFHYANEILPGTFVGDFTFDGDVNISSGKDLCIDGGKCLSSSGSVSGITTSAGTCAAEDCDLRSYDGAGSGLDADLFDGVDSASFLRSNIDDTLTAAIIVPTGNRDEGMFGTYDSTKTQHIWSMGTAYRNNAAGANFGNLYGLAYKHTNNPTGGNLAGGHQMVWAQNGNPTSAMGTNIWTSGAFYGAGTGLTGTAASLTAGSVTTPSGTYKHLGAWGVGRTAPGAILVNTAYRADYATTAGNAAPITCSGAGWKYSGRTSCSGACTSYTCFRMYCDGSKVTQMATATCYDRSSSTTSGGGGGDGDGGGDELREDLEFLRNLINENKYLIDKNEYDSLH